MHLNLLTATWRDVREFLASKRIKREPLKWRAKGAARAEILPRDARHFARLRQSIRHSSDFGRASERIDRLERELSKRDTPLPLPRKMIQEEDRSVSLFWNGLMVRAFPDGFVFIIEGKHPGKGYARELIEALILRSRMQRQ